MLDADGHKARKAQDTMARFVKTLQGMLQGRALILEDLNRADGVLDEPAGLRGRAREARTIGDDMTVREGKRMMLRVAKSYERLAKRAEHRLARRRPRSG